jgi:hypothetical protein
LSAASDKGEKFSPQIFTEKGSTGCQSAISCCRRLKLIDYDWIDIQSKVSDGIELPPHRYPIKGF